MSGSEGVETGYETRFDFPERQAPPERSYLLATVPRSGSTYLSHVLWRTGCLGAPLEYLNFEPSGPYGHASDSPAEQQRLWATALHHRTSPNGVFGLKGFPPQFEALAQRNASLLRQVMRQIVPSPTAARLVRLHRRDRIAHAISYARAIISGVWRAEQEREGTVEPDYSPIAVERADRLIATQEAAWSAMIAELGLKPLALYYEDVVADPGGAVAEVARFLGVEVDPALEVEIPSIRRQSQKGARAWAQRHRNLSPPDGL